MPLDAITDKTKIKWYLRPIIVVLALLSAGPFAIPLVWISPAFKKWHKILLTVLVVLFTIWTIKLTIDLYKMLMKEAMELKELLITNI